MFKILRFISGPYEEGGYVWCVAEIEDDTGTHEEEIFYDTIEEALSDHGLLDVDFEDDWLTEQEESEVDSFG